ncbi:PaaX family transcriptional regulator C-terminal domain-containing protein [Lacimonas salitolerans]|uniref:PaaX family transcriptional regulator C-terminal domain-containing protein n=1 Tax=Lacimonas salitolerans TaxID=1323750 RepID=A0ABW4EE37_9RHOB
MDPLAPLIDTLHADGRLRVWSLVITVFGDSVQLRGGRVTSARLGRLLGRIGVEPGALRTALSRLARDGWVDSTREGRLSHYRLTAGGKARFTDATSRIYAVPRGPVAEWALSLDDGADDTALHLGGLALRPADAPAPRARFRMTGRIAALAPDLVVADVLTADHASALDTLRVDLAALTAVHDPLDAAAARTLLIHRWRRIVLRHPELCAPLLPSGWPDAPRAAVARAWHALTPQAESWWDRVGPDLPPMPPADPALWGRFGGRGLD